MCGMRRTNGELVRETADMAAAEEQLDILHRRGLRAVAVLTGEYHHGPFRRTMIARSAALVRAALARGFVHVLVNIGALDADEYDVLLAELPRGADGRVVPQVTMCTFQETYSPDAYARFMGTNPENPRSDYARRLTNFERARDAGMWVANPGVLLGLNDDVIFELLALLAHVHHLQERGMSVYVSLPRLRKASGTAYAAGVSDDLFARVVAVLTLGVPDAKVVVSTRESPAIQRRLLPVIGVLTPGSPGVAPYTETGARFELEASQFEVLDHRPIEAILGEHLAAGATIDCYEPAARV
jgi:2-iminoacetate synthase